MKILWILSLFLVGALADRIFLPENVNPLSDEYIDLHNKLNTTWKAGRNFPEGTPLSYIKNLCRSKKNSNAKLPVAKNKPVIVIPKEFDARAKWPECPSIGKIYNQGECGASWVFATVGVMTDRICILSKGAKKPQISAMDLMTCCNFCGGGEGCRGGGSASMSGWLHFKMKGLVTAGCKPYTFSEDPESSKGKTPKCVKSCVAGYNKTYNADKHFAKSFYALNPSNAQIQTDIMTNGPVEAYFQVYTDFANYKSGVYIRHSTTQIGGHTVKVIGWGVENNIKYWLAANSWGTYWGEKGYLKIQRGTDECEIDDNMSAGIPLL